MNYLDEYYDGYDTIKTVEIREPCPCPCTLPRAIPVARIHTPEREEARLVEGRYGISDFDVAATHFDLTYQRRGEAWIDEVTIDGRPWMRGAMWFSPPDRVNVEASSREAFDEMVAVVQALPITVKKRSTREHMPAQDNRSYFYSYSSQRLHRGDVLPNRPNPGPAEFLQALRDEHELRWLQQPHDLLDGLTPEEAAKDATTVSKLYYLFEFAHDKGHAWIGLPEGTDLNSVRAKLGIGRRW